MLLIDDTSHTFVNSYLYGSIDYLLDNNFIGKSFGAPETIIGNRADLINRNDNAFHLENIYKRKPSLIGLETLSHPPST